MGSASGGDGGAGSAVTASGSGSAWPRVTGWVVKTKVKGSSRRSCFCIELLTC